MTKQRWPENRWRGEVGDPSIWADAYRSPWPLPERTYTLRMIPQSCQHPEHRSWVEPQPYPGCRRLDLTDLLVDAGFGELSWSRKVGRGVLDVLRVLRITEGAQSYGMGMAWPIPEGSFNRGRRGRPCSSPLPAARAWQPSLPWRSRA